MAQTAASAAPLCVQKSQCAVAELLLARGAAVDGASADSPLSLAVLVRRCCAAPQCATAACLTDEMANDNERQHNRLDLARLLLAHGADVHHSLPLIVKVRKFSLTSFDFLVGWLTSSEPSRRGIFLWRRCCSITIAM